MPKFLIFIKKHLFTKPKWRILRVFTKVVKRSSLEKVKKWLENDIKFSEDTENTAFLKWQLAVINYFLEQ